MPCRAWNVPMGKWSHKGCTQIPLPPQMRTYQFLREWSGMFPKLLRAHCLREKPCRPAFSSPHPEGFRRIQADIQRAYRMWAHQRPRSEWLLPAEFKNTRQESLFLLEYAHRHMHTSWRQIQGRPPVCRLIYKWNKIWGFRLKKTLFCGLNCHVLFSNHCPKTTQK